MTIPQQECIEKKVPECNFVPREECKMVPKEKCTQVLADYARPSKCRIISRIECTDKPRQKCGKKVNIVSLLKTFICMFSDTEHVQESVQTKMFG